MHRRLERVGDAAGVTVIDDFAHHPTEIAATLAALRQRFPGRRLVAVFEPRSLTSGRSFLLDGYERAFSHADVVHLAPIFHAGRLRDEERLDTGELRARLERAGVRVVLAPSVAAVLDGVLGSSRAGRRGGDDVLGQLRRHAAPHRRRARRVRPGAVRLDVARGSDPRRSSGSSSSSAVERVAIASGRRPISSPRSTSTPRAAASSRTRWITVWSGVSAGRSRLMLTCARPRLSR